ncbi:MAG: phospholipase [Halothiobacillaceae bacterium]|nr:phospholipase [Halothiobacillaceae bacterium]HER34919.1 phospholipase [Halothiobacillaceae bacterium]
MGLRRKPLFLTIITLSLLAWLIMGMWHVYKPMPGGLDVATPWVPAQEVRFLADTTYQAPDGTLVSDQRIFDAIGEMIRGAQRLLVLDMFLFNDFAGDSGAAYRPLSSELTGAIAERRHRRPAPRTLLITDPVNTVYGSLTPSHFERLRTAGVDIVFTDLERLRDPNPIWSGLWRLCCQALEASPDQGWLPNPLAEPPVALASWMRLLNVKANHRKTIVADLGDQWQGLVTSANPHDASSRHGNVALRFAGPAALDLLATERSAAALSGHGDAFTAPRKGLGNATNRTDEGRLRILTEARIREAALDLIEAAGPDDRLDLAMFYLSHRGVIEALKRAAERGVPVRVLLDPNHDAFGRQKSGLPNRPVGNELHRAGVQVRWCLTHGEQCHAKLLVLSHPDGSGKVLLGSANFTRRNLDNFNMETDVEWQAPAGHPALTAILDYVARRWNNQDGEQHSLPFSHYADGSLWRYWRYRVMEATGLSTF